MHIKNLLFYIIISLLLNTCKNHPEKDDTSSQIDSLYQEQSPSLSSSNEDSIFTNIYFEEAKIMFDSLRNDTALILCNYALDENIQYYKNKGVNDAKIYFLKAKIHYKNNSFKEALSQYEKALLTWEKEPTENQISIANSYSNIGLTNKRLGNISVAIEMYYKALTIREKVYGKLHIEVAKIHVNLGATYNTQRSYKKSLMFHESALKIFRSQEKINDAYLRLCYNNIGTVYGMENKFDIAISYFNKSLDLLKKDSDAMSAANLYFNVGHLSYDLGNYSMALDYLKKAEVIFLNNGNRTYTAICQRKIGHLYSKFMDFDKSFEYQKVALETFQDIYGDNHYQVASSYSTLGDSFGEEEDYEKAMEYFYKAIDTWENLPNRDSFNYALYLNNIGAIFERMTQYDSSLVYSKKSLQIRMALKPKDSLRIATSLYNIGYSLGEKKMYDESFLYMNNALDIIQNYLNEKTPLVARINANMAVIYGEKQENENVIKHFNKALVSLNFNPKEKYSFDYILSHRELLHTLNGYSDFYSNLYLKTKNIKYVYKKYYYDDIACKLIQYIQKSTSIWNTTNLEWSTFEKSLKSNALLFQHSDSASYLNAFFAVAEQAKNLNLLQGINQTNALRFSGIPDSILLKENALKINITYYEKKRNEESTNRDLKNDSIIEQYNATILNLKYEYGKFIKVMEVTYPKYFQMKYAKSIISIKAVQDSILSPNQALIEYFVGDSSVYIFTILPDTFHVHEIKKDFPLQQWVEEMRDGIYGNFNKYQFDRTVQNKMYTAAAFNIYSKVFAPIKDILPEDAELIIIPDGVLGYVPFDALLTKQVEDINDFSSFSYLLQQHSISYAYSATFLKKMKYKKHDKVGNKTMLAMAPFYNEDSSLLASIFPFTRIVKKKLSALPNTGNEVNTIKNLIGGEVLTHGEATKDFFIKNAEKYKILHLATHGQANDQTGDYSFLVFAENKNLDSLDNQLLYVKDLYNLKLNAEMVVLSACETGIGELQRGEGIISLARGFSYAGAKSIVTTLWTVSDKSSSELMNLFYTNLKSGLTKDKALRKAKMDYLKSSPNIEPFYWAAFIPIGNMEKIELNSGVSIWGWMIVVGGGLLMLLGFRYFKQKE